MLTGFDLCRAAVAVTGISAPEQSVLMVLAIMANDRAQCWPPIGGETGLMSKTKLSERSVQNAVKALTAAGHITRDEKPGRGVLYTVHPRTECTPAANAPAHDMRPAGGASTPAPPAPKQPVTTIPKKIAGTAKPKPTRVPSDFAPSAKAGSLTAKAMDDWPPGVLAEQVEHFVDHHTTHGTLSLDWQASWRTWVKNWKRFNADRPRHHRSRGRGLFGAVLDAEHDSRVGQGF